MEEKMLLEWKEAHAEVYAKFKEKFPDFHINKGYDWAEALCNAVLSDDMSC